MSIVEIQSQEVARTIRRNIRSIMGFAELKQAQLAKRLDMSDTSVSDRVAEKDPASGKKATRITAEELPRWARALGCTVNAFYAETSAELLAILTEEGFQPNGDGAASTPWYSGGDGEHALTRSLDPLAA